MLIRNIVEALFGERQAIQSPLTTEEMSQEENNNVKIIVPQQFRDDIDNLKKYVGENNWKAGLEISLYLSELLLICPHGRRRSDSFKKLIAYLDDELKIKLIIKERNKK